MRSRKKLSGILAPFAVFALALAIAGLYTACSDDATAPTTKAIGDVNDSQFVAVQGQLNDAALDYEALDWMDVVWDSVPALSSVIRGSADGLNNRAVGTDTLLTFTMTIDAVNKWIIINALVASGVDTATLWDSVRILSNGVPVLPDFAGDSADGIELRAHARIAANSSVEFVGFLSSHVTLDATVIGKGDSLGGDTTLANATAIDTISGSFTGEGGACEMTMTSTKSATNLMEIDSPEFDCPIDGDVVATATMDLSCVDTAQNTLDVMGSWSVNVSFNSDQSANVVYENATTRWTATVPCTPGPVAQIQFPGRD